VVLLDRKIVYGQYLNDQQQKQYINQSMLEEFGSIQNHTDEMFYLGMKLLFSASMRASAVFTGFTSTQLAPLLIMFHQ